MLRTSLQNGSIKQHTGPDTAVVFSKLKDMHLLFSTIHTFNSEKHSAQILPLFWENPVRAQRAAMLWHPLLVHYNVHIQDHVLRGNNTNMSEDADPSNWGRNDSQSSLQQPSAAPQKQRDACSELPALRRLSLKNSQGWIPPCSAAPGSHLKLSVPKVTLW